MNETVESFYIKNPQEDYLHTYDTQHGPRLDAMIRRFNLSALKGQRILDVGGGLGFLGKRLDPSNDYWVLDGAAIAPADRLCKGTWHTVDLDYHTFGEEDGDNCLARKQAWDVAFCLETLEHLPGVYNCVVQMKKLVKRDGDIHISVPTESVWHNTPFPSLFWPQDNFRQWLGQMALPILEEWTYHPAPGGGWPAYHYRCRNADWTEAKMLFPKSEPKFYGKLPHEYANL